MTKKVFFIILLLLHVSLLAVAQTNPISHVKPESEKLSDLLLKIFTILSAVGALVSGYYAHIAGRLSKAGLAYNFFTRYSDDKMVTSLRLIGNMRREHKESLVPLWLEAKKNKEEWADKVENARHIIKYFYRDVATLYQSHCMNYKMAKKICSAGGIHVFMTTVLEMDGKINNHKIEKEFHPLGKIYRHFIKLEERKHHHDIAARVLRIAKVSGKKFGIWEVFVTRLLIYKIKKHKNK